MIPSGRVVALAPRNTNKLLNDENLHHTYFCSRDGVPWFRRKYQQEDNIDMGNTGPCTISLGLHTSVRNIPDKIRV